MIVENTSEAECTASEIMALECAAIPAISLKPASRTFAMIVTKATRRARAFADLDSDVIKSSSFKTGQPDMLQNMRAPAGNADKKTSVEHIPVPQMLKTSAAESARHYEPQGFLA